MTRHEFDREFAPMTRALGVKCTRSQAEYFFQEFQKADPRDLALACRELAMGRAGQLPEIGFFRENVAGAKEMRVAGEQLQRGKKNAQASWQQEKVIEEPGHEAHTRLFAQCCSALVRAGQTLSVADAGALIRQAMTDEAFVAWCATWKPEKRDGVNAKQWLESHLSVLVKKAVAESSTPKAPIATVPDPPDPPEADGGGASLWDEDEHTDEEEVFWT